VSDDWTAPIRRIGVPPCGMASGACSTLLTTLSKRDTSNRSECGFLIDE